MAACRTVVPLAEAGSAAVDPALRVWEPRALRVLAQVRAADWLSAHRAARIPMQLETKPEVGGHRKPEAIIFH